MVKTLIIEEAWLRGGFTQVPNCVLRDEQLEPSAKLLYSLLLSYAWHNDQCYPGHERLAKEIGISRRWAIRLLQRLRDRGLVTWSRRGQGKTNVYVILSLLNVYPETDVNSSSLPKLSSSSPAEMKPSSQEEYSVEVDTEKNIRLSRNTEIAKMQAYMMGLLNTTKDLVPNPGKEAGFIGKMKKRGFGWDEILPLWIEKVTQRREFVSMQWVNEDIGKGDGNGAHRRDTQEDRSARRAASIGAPIVGRRG